MKYVKIAFCFVASKPYVAHARAHVSKILSVRLVRLGITLQPHAHAQTLCACHTRMNLNHHIVQRIIFFGNFLFVLVAIYIISTNTSGFRNIYIKFNNNICVFFFVLLSSWLFCFEYNERNEFHWMEMRVICSFSYIFLLFIRY